MQYLMSGGLPGTGAAGIPEIITIDNASSSALNIRFYQYSDFDVSAGTDVPTIGTIGGKAFVATQTGGGQTLSETVVGPGADRWEAALWDSTLTNLDNALAFYQLNDVVSAGPGDVTWAFQ